MPVIRGRPTAILEGAVTDARSDSFTLRNTNLENKAQDVCVTTRGTLGTATCAIEVSHDGVNWIPTGETLESGTEAVIVTLGAGMYLSVDYNAGGGSEVTVEVS